MLFVDVFWIVCDFCWCDFYCNDSVGVAFVAAFFDNVIVECVSS